MYVIDSHKQNPRLFVSGQFVAIALQLTIFLVVA